MTLGKALDLASARLTGPTARSDAEVLLRHITGFARTELLLNLSSQIDDTIAKAYFEVIAQLASGEPLQYLTGHIEFFGLDFYVNSSVLIPRPETEIMVEKALEIGRGYGNPVIADVGCGSGAVAVTLATHLPQSWITALDISKSALDLARKNAGRYNCENIEFIESDLLELVARKHFDIVCANLPYVPTLEAANNIFEPQLALDGGPDGLDVIRRLVRQIAALADKPGWLLLEFGTGQTQVIESALKEYLPGSQTEILTDLIPLDRVSVTKLQ
jgi:release factor glutamine methyltransferase